MVFKLNSRIQAITQTDLPARIIGKITDNFSTPKPLRSEFIFINNAKENIVLPEGFAAYLLFYTDSTKEFSSKNIFLLPKELNYIAKNDIVLINSERLFIRVLYRKNSPYNSILVTENCNNYCLMCSQPPRNVNDRYLIKEILSMIPLIDKDASEIGITGGEPTLLGDDLVTIFKYFNNYLPNTAIHVLTNGRKFSDLNFIKKISRINHPDLMFGIPIYSDVPHIHDYVVQAKNAYNETIKGIINLKSFSQRVEIRVVLHKQTYKRLPKLAEFITRNLLFVDHVALMGLEIVGFTKANLDDLWIDPFDYQNELVEAVKILDRFKMNISIYNHQLCLLHPSLWRFAKKSISDWKNKYMPECNTCTLQHECGGFFSSADYKYSDHIQAFE